VVCGAVAAADGRCLAHLAQDQLAAYLATLGPGSDIDARGVKFSPVGKADFSGAVFTGSASFRRVRFAGRVDFSETAFHGYAHFYRVSFREGVSFNLSTFIKGTRFSRVAFKDANFRSARFHGGAVLLCRAQELVLAGAEVSGELAVEATVQSVNAAGMRGDGRLSLRLRAATVNLDGVVFNGPISVNALQHPLDWDESDLGDPVTGVPPVRVVSLVGADPEQLVLSDVDLTSCQFAGMHRMDQIFFDGRCIFRKDPRGLRQVLAEESYWRASRQSSWSRRSKYRWTPGPTGVEVVSPARLEVMYRQLRKAVEDVKNEPGAADFYYGEMEMRRAATQRLGEKIILWLYWASSGYAVRFARALACMAVTIAAAITVLTVWGFLAMGISVSGHGIVMGQARPETVTFTMSEASPVTSESARVEQATEITLNAVIFRGADIQLTTVGRYVDIVARVLGPLFLALSALAIRNQVKR
jgi:uncharacterized protein YjbI with pentapeptide repeats